MRTVVAQIHFSGNYVWAKDYVAPGAGIKKSVIVLLDAHASTSGSRGPELPGNAPADAPKAEEPKAPKAQEAPTADAKAPDDEAARLARTPAFFLSGY